MALQTTITFLGHASVLIENGSDRIVFDPMLRQHLLWLKRHDEAVFDFEKLWQVQMVIITSPRWGRFDHHSLKFFKQRVARVLAPEGATALLAKFFHFHLEKPVETEKIGAGSFTIIPYTAPHNSWRCFRYHKQSWHYIIKTSDRTIFYGSDTALNRNFYARVAMQHQIDTAILPIDFVHLPGTNKNQFLSPEDAAHAAQELKAKQIIPCQFGSFNEQGRAMLERFQAELTKLGSAEKGHVLQPGGLLKI